MIAVEEASVEVRVREMTDRRWWCYLFPAIVVGVLLRAWRLSSQVIGGDEVYGLESALAMGMSKILITYQVADNCIPLTAFYRLLLEMGVPLSELTMRAPSLLAGVAALIALPVWLRRQVGDWQSLLFALLLAVAPLHVYYSRMARPYAITVLLAWLSVMAFARWRRHSELRWAVAFIGLAPLTGFFHLGMAPMVCLLPVVACVLDLARRDWSAFARTTAVGLSTAAGFLAFLVPARESLAALVEDKRVAIAVDADTARGLLHLMTGTESVVLALLLVALVIPGGWLIWRTGSVSLRWLLAASAGQLLGIWVLSPFGMERAHVLARYIIPLHPVMILCWSMILVLLTIRMTGPALVRSLRSGRLLVAILLLWLVGTGPFADRLWWKSNFTQSVSWLFFWQEVELLEVPEIYSLIQGPVIEAPWNYVFRFSFFVEAYQRQHGLDVAVLPTKPLWSDPRLSMVSSLPMDLDRLLESKAAWLIVHENPVAESTLDPAFLPWRGFRKGYFVERETRNREMMMETERVRLQPALTAWRGRLGPADHMGDGIVVWNLERVRSEADR